MIKTETMRRIKKIHKPEYAPVGDLVTYRVLPTKSINSLDPFLFLNHHGPQKYGAPNNGLPFGPHPHRGMETVTFILEGDIAHKDSSGHDSVITAGGVQWMTAGSGLIHAEVSSEEFKKKGGPLEILQLWINLPARSKMVKPFYKGLQKEEIPTLMKDEGRVIFNLVSGDMDGHTASFSSGIGMHLYTVHFKPGGKLDMDIPADNQVFFYVIRGSLEVNGQLVDKLSLVEFDQNDTRLSVSSPGESLLLLGYAKPLGEPVVAQGPFVMNTQQEIEKAFEDYQSGKFGTWEH
jgi:redox-sensitive bicupin YhaK (pirin superfamily)